MVICKVRRISDDTLAHNGGTTTGRNHKYIKRERVNNKWRYTYPEDIRGESDDLKSFNRETVGKLANIDKKNIENDPKKYYKDEVTKYSMRTSAEKVNMKNSYNLKSFNEAASNAIKNAEKWSQSDKKLSEYDDIVTKTKKKIKKFFSWL